MPSAMAGLSAALLRFSKGNTAIDRTGADTVTTLRDTVTEADSWPCFDQTTNPPASAATSSIKMPIGQPFVAARAGMFAGPAPVGSAGGGRGPKHQTFIRN